MRMYVCMYIYIYIYTLCYIKLRYIIGGQRSGQARAGQGGPRRAQAGRAASHANTIL